MTLMSKAVTSCFYCGFYYNSGEFYQRKHCGALIYTCIPVKRKGGRKSLRDIYLRDILCKYKHDSSSRMRIFAGKCSEKKR